MSPISETLKQYRITSVTGDSYAGLWPTDAFAKHGITYQKADQTEVAVYLAILPLVNSRKVVLLDSDRLVRQFVGLDAARIGAARTASITNPTDMMTSPTLWPVALPWPNAAKILGTS